jgi:hypothetical protein
MRQLLGLPLPDSILHRWSGQMVFALEPLFLPLGLAQNFDVPLTRAEFGQWIRLQPLEYADAYQPWCANGDWVVLAQHLPAAPLPSINAAVVASKRGLVFPLELAKGFGVPEHFLERDTSGDQFILRLDAWNALTQASALRGCVGVSLKTHCLRPSIQIGMGWSGGSQEVGQIVFRPRCWDMTPPCAASPIGCNHKPYCECLSNAAITNRIPATTPNRTMSWCGKKANKWCMPVPIWAMAWC